jgi:hypothetical protein
MAYEREGIRQDWSDRIGPVNELKAQFTGSIAEPVKFLRSRTTPKVGTFLIIKTPVGAAAFFLSQENEASFQAEVLPVVRGDHITVDQVGSGLVLEDGRRLLLSGGRDAARQFVGSIVLYS